MSRSGLGVLAAALGFVTAAPSLACPGDCNADGVVGVEEIVTVVSVLLGEQSIAACDAADYDLDDDVEVHEAVLAVRASFDGCPMPVCGNGILELGEECEGSDIDLRCYSDCSVCCVGEQCLIAKCCFEDLIDGFVPFDPGCRNCGEVGEGCSATGFARLGCCDDLDCWDLSSPDPRLLAGTCCRGPGSRCDVDGDCCGASSFPWPSLPDLCVAGRCCVQTGSVCSDFDGLRGPCCDPAARCSGRTAVEGWQTCCLPGADGVCCVERGGQCELFGQSLGPCCAPNDECSGPGIGGGATCCAPSGEPCAESPDCCSGSCVRADDGSPALCQ